MKRVFSASVLIFLLIIVFTSPIQAADVAKAPATPLTDKQKLPGAGSGLTVAASVLAEVPQVAELDRLKLLNAALEYQLLLTQFENSDTVSAIKTKLRVLIAEVLQKAGNPTDYQLDPVTWNFVKKPAPSFMPPPSAQ